MKAFPVALLCLTIATPAAAIGPSLPIPGLYAGVEGGSGSRAGVDLDGSRDHEHSFDYGAFAGIELPSGGLTYLAGEAEIGSTSAKLNTTAGIDGAEHEARVNPQWNWAATARLGLRPFPGLAAYGIAGYGGERVKVRVIDDDAGEQDRGWLKGVVYGVGARYVLGTTLVRVEYRHRNTNGRYDPDQLLAGIGFHF